MYLIKFKNILLLRIWEWHFVWDGRSTYGRYPAGCFSKKKWTHVMCPSHTCWDIWSNNSKALTKYDASSQPHVISQWCCVLQVKSRGCRNCAWTLYLHILKFEGSCPIDGIESLRYNYFYLLPFSNPSIFSIIIYVLSLSTWGILGALTTP